MEILTVSNKQTIGILGRILTNVIALGVSYALSFIGCDLIFNHFSLQQSIKSAPWFLLGPFLWRWGTAVPWLFEIVKNFLENKWDSVKEKLLEWFEQKIGLVYLPGIESFAETLDTKYGPALIENMRYQRDELLR